MDARHHRHKIIVPSSLSLSLSLSLTHTHTHTHTANATGLPARLPTPLGFKFKEGE